MRREAIGSIYIDGLKTVSEMNVREHWYLRKVRASQQRLIVGDALEEQASEIGPVLRAAHATGHTLCIEIVRVSLRQMDSDNAVVSCKHIRDAIAKWLGIDDGDPRLDWRVKQAKSIGLKQFGVRITFYIIRGTEDGSE